LFLPVFYSQFPVIKSAKDALEGFSDDEDFSPAGGLQKGANITRRRNVLGRGLSALMSSSAVPVDFSANTARAMPPLVEGSAVRKVQAENETQAAVAAKDGPLEGGLIYLSIDRVSANKAQPRQTFLQQDIDKLSDSIKKSGLLQPIVVRRRIGETGPLASYEIVAGERRWRAAKQAGLVKIPALLKQLSDKEALELGIIENVQRADLNPIEEALAYQRLSQDFGASQQEIADTVGKDRASIANALRLLKLAPDVQHMLTQGSLSAGHGRALLMLESAEEQKTLAERILREGLSVRAVEEIAGSERKNSVRQRPRAGAAEIDPSRGELEDRLRRALGTKVKLMLDKAGKGEIRVSFFSAAELQRLIEKLES
jgi:ParB family chromosome partitioning protein